MPWFRATFFACACCCVTQAADWPQWLGPNRNGTSTEKVAAWTKNPEVVWRQPVGEGNSSPVIAANRAFIHAKVKDKDDEEVIAYDAKTGKELWRTAYTRDAFQSLFGNGPRATPAVDGDHVYTFGITGVLTCFEAGSGKQLWQVDTLKQFQAKNLFFGMACSPLVVDGNVVVNVGGTGASIVAFDKEKGTVAWKSLNDKASYSSPIVTGSGKDRQLVFLTGQSVASLNPADGSEYWRFPLVDKLFESSTTPVRAGNLLLASSITYGSAGLQLANQDEKPTFKEAWKNPTLTCYFSTPVAVGDGHIFLVTGNNPLAIKKPEATLRCIDAKTGKEEWSKAGVGTYHAALLRTGDGKLLMLDDRGTLTMLEPDLKEFHPLAKATVCGETWAHPALSDGRLYMRDNKEVICLKLGE